MKGRWLLASLPLVLAFLATLLLDGLVGTDPIFNVRISLSVLLLFAGAVLSLFLGLALALWQWRGQYRQLLQAQRQAALADHHRFLQRLDHELKNPLMAIRAALANFGDAPAREARGGALGSIEAQTVRLSRLTSDLRKIADLETRPLERRPVDLAVLLPEVIDLAQDLPGADRRRLTLSIPRAPWPLPTISGDWDLIFLALYNLVENALKYTRPEDTIEVRAREDGQLVVIDVADTGPGIAPRDLPHVWEELYRGEGARGVAGSGLGLALVKVIAERHGGRVQLHSRSGQGTVVTLVLPAG